LSNGITVVNFAFPFVDPFVPTRGSVIPSESMTGRDKSTDPMSSFILKVIKMIINEDYTFTLSSSQSKTESVRGEEKPPQSSMLNTKGSHVGLFIK